MAVTVVDTIDPTEEPVIRQLHPRPPKPGEVDPSKVMVSYDRRSDTLLIHLFGRDRSSVSVQVAPYVYLLTDPETEALVGFHVEGFLAQAVKDVPAAIDILDHAELRGITPTEVRALRSSTLGNRQRFVAWLRTAFARGPQERKRRSVAAFLEAERTRWGLPAVPA